MPILCRHIQVYTLGRLSIDGFSFELEAQFNLKWIFSKLDSGFESLVGFRILSVGFRIPKPRIPDSRGKKFLDSGILIPLNEASSEYIRYSNFPQKGIDSGYPLPIKDNWGKVPQTYDL